MAPKGTKRARPAAAGEAKKLKTASKAVAKALLDADLPAAVRSVLSTAAPYALAEYSEARTSHQAAVVGMVGTAMTAMQAALQTAVADANGKVAGQSEEKAKREAAVFEAAAAIATKKGEVAKSEYAELEATMNFKKADALLKETIKAQKAADKTYAAIEAKITHLDEIKAKVEVMKAGKCPRKDVTSLEKDMLKFCKIDPTLMQSMHLCLTKDPADLSDFEKTMMSKLDDEINACAEVFKKELAEEQPAKDTRTKAFEEAQAAQADAKAKLDGCKSAHSEASSEVTKAKAGLSAAEASVASYDDDMAELEAGLTAAQDALTSFNSGPLNTFEVLKAHTAPPPEPEEVPAEEPAPAAAAAE